MKPTCENSVESMSMRESICVLTFKVRSSF